jgi:hypothetical protein
MKKSYTGIITVVVVLYVWDERSRINMMHVPGEDVPVRGFTKQQYKTISQSKQCSYCLCIIGDDVSQ